MATNTDAAVSFLKLAASGRAREAFAAYAGPGFRHHNPWFPGDIAIQQVGERAEPDHPARNMDVPGSVETTTDDRPDGPGRRDLVWTDPPADQEIHHRHDDALTGGPELVEQGHVGGEGVVDRLTCNGSNRANRRRIRELRNH